MRTPWQLRQRLKALIGDGPTYWHVSEATATGYYLADNIPLAVKVARESLATAESVGQESPEYARAATNLGFLLTWENDLKEADRLLRKAAEVNLNTYGLDGLPYYETLDRLAFLKLRQGNAIEAFVLGREAAAGIMRVMKTEDCKFASVIFTCGMASVSLHRRDDAKSALLKFQELANGRMKPDHPLLFETRESLKRLAAEMIDGRSVDAAD